MHQRIQARREIVAALHERSVLATAEFYKKVGRAMPVIKFRLQVKPAGRDFFHVVDSQTGKVMGFRRDHNAACAFARKLEQE